VLGVRCRTCGPDDRHHRRPQAVRAEGTTSGSTSTARPLIGPTSLYSSYTVVIEANADRDVAGFAPTTAKSFNVMKVADSHDLWLKGHRVARYELRGVTANASPAPPRRTRTTIRAANDARLRFTCHLLARARQRLKCNKRSPALPRESYDADGGAARFASHPICNVLRMTFVVFLGVAIAGVFFGDVLTAWFTAFIKWFSEVGTAVLTTTIDEAQRRLGRG